MRLDYKILWIEDEENWRKSIQKDIEKHIIENGHNPIINAPDKIDEQYINNCDFSDYDLMLVDYTLKSLSTDTGDILIEKIRRNKVYTNIVFYSSDTNKLKTEISNKKLGGVYIFDRSQFNKDNIDEFFDLIDFFLIKDMDINSLRGIVMSEVAKFDSIIWSIFTFENCKNDVAIKIKEQRLKSYNDIKDSTDDALWQKVLERGTAILDSTSRKDILHSKILKDKYNCHKICENDKKCYCKMLTDYGNDVIRLRNELAHHISPNITADDKINLMKNLIEFRSIFNDIEKCLCKKP